jgi:chemotaxis protein methyltransferase CheR
MTISDKDFFRLRDFIYSNFGVNLAKKRTLIEGRLSNYIIQEGFDGFTDFIDDTLADKSGKKIDTLMTKLTTNYTYFMREDTHYKFMQEVALPYWTQNIKNKDLRIWSAGCSSGEEPYTTVMVLHEWFGPKISQWDATVLATDLSVRVLDLAKTGVYPEEHFENLPVAWKNKYFEKIGEEKYKIKPVLAKGVHFGQLNLMTNFVPKFKRKFHIIFCRNVMIYFDSPTKEALVKRYHDALEVGGFLFIGLSESLSGIQGDLQQVQPAIYRRVK